MAEQYVPGLQFQNWAALPSLTQSLMSGEIAKTPLGVLGAAALGYTYDKNGWQKTEKTEPTIPGAVIPEQNMQNWNNIPQAQLGAPVPPPPGLNPAMIGQNPFGLGPMGLRMPKPSQQNTDMDINRIKETLWE